MLIADRNGFLVGGKLSAKSYEGSIVVQWDGIENVAYGQHNATSTKWVDLIGGEELTFSDFTKVEWTLNSIKSLGSGSYTLHEFSSSLWTTIKSAIRQCRFAIEYVWYANASFFSTAASSGYSGVLPIVVGGAGNVGVVPYFTKWNNGGWASNPFNAGYGYYWTPFTAFTPATTSYYSQTYVIDSLVNASIIHVLHYINGVEVGNSDIPNIGYAPAGDWSNAVQNNQMRLFPFQANGIEVCAIRIHDQIPTADEIAANYAVDKSRFNLP